jgi:hypothetical protein
MGPEVFLASVAEPDTEDLGDLFSLVRGEALVEGEGTVPFAAAGLVFVRVPMGPSQADASAGFLDELRAGEIGVVLFVLLGGHETSRVELGEYTWAIKEAPLALTVMELLRVPVARESKEYYRVLTSGKQPERLGLWRDGTVKLSVSALPKWTSQCDFGRESWPKWSRKAQTLALHSQS